ncbi:aspartate:alanine exchanger family transporter [Sulfuriroseicoccus oceanibius]|uniref:YidE/YbjL duplication n=1 Tax=Sulfuriroseicoccus oceanibius TaxID=2707525 RepID=A0A6B3L906_9BACT|nr:TrkA C-terminal domain-containing protein [Sulfuriroseicoccus oceanibius]QQL44131.1 YidE/YbjL duplication [Sulfuriroseicoccus oceanibius]
MDIFASFMTRLFDLPLMHHPVFVVFSVIAIGLIVGRFSVYGVSLGSAAVMFVALVYGHYGVTLNQSLTSFGLVLFVYCVGIGAGSRFFGALKERGVQFAVIALAVVAVGGVATALVAGAFGVSPSVAAGVFAGALTSTPGLAAAQEHFSSGVDQGLVSAGYAIAYPFGVIGVVLFVQLWPRLRKADLAEIGRKLDEEQEQAHKILPVLVKMTNPKFVGRRIDELSILDRLRCRVIRTMKNGVLVPIEHGHVLELDQLLWVIGRDDEIDSLLDVLGERASVPVVINTFTEQQTFVLTERSLANRRIGDLRLLRDHGVSIARILRYEYELVPTDSTELNVGDQLVVVGSPENLQKFAKVVGHRASVVDATDLVSLAVGVAIGVVVGMIPLGSFKLGLAGGPLLVALVLGHFGRVGAIAGYVPRPTRVLLRELGLCLFLAGAGIKGGASVVETLQSQGAGIFIVGLVATVMPIVIGHLVATKIFKFDLLTALGTVCGAMTSTPGLGAVSGKTDSQAPVVSYAAAYPAALLLMVVGVGLLLEIMAAMV